MTLSPPQLHSVQVNTNSQFIKSARSLTQRTVKLLDRICKVTIPHKIEKSPWLHITRISVAVKHDQQPPLESWSHTEEQGNNNWAIRITVNNKTIDHSEGYH